jgi:hypothetical protein
MPFYPDDAVAPEGLRLSRLVLRPLRAADAALDYDAVMSDAQALQRWSQSSWPADDFTLAENRTDLERHEREHGERVAFTYTVLSPDQGTCLGCVYLTPVFPEAARLVAGAMFPVQLGFWVRAAEVGGELDRYLFEALREWLRTSWRFDAVVLAISQKDERQESVVRDAGLGPGAALTLGDGRECWVFVEWIDRSE